MSGEVLRRGVDDQVCAVLQRAKQDRAEERVVGDEQELVAAGDGRLGRRDPDAQPRVGRTLDEQRPGGRRDRRFDGGEVGRVDATYLDAAAREVLVEEDVGDREELFARDEVVAAPRCAKRVAATAAMPEAETTASSAPSSDASFSSSARFVGFPVRE